MGEVTVAWGRDSPRARYALDVLLGLLGTASRDAGPDEQATLGYAATGAKVVVPAGGQEGWDEPRPSLMRIGGLPVLHRPGDTPRAPSTGDLGFDALYAAYACLTAPWEAVDPRNEVGTPTAAEGWLCRNGLLEEPLVHRYAEALRELLAEAGIATRRRKPALVLTHDVDEQFGRLFGVREGLIRLGRDLRRGRPGSVRRTAGLARQLALHWRNDPNDCWDEWRRLLEDWSGAAAFFVASFNLFDRGAGRFDVAYDVRRPEVAREVCSLAQAGAEIGIHFSLQANTSAEQVLRERRRLEDALGLEIRSCRHHWWALGPDPLRTLRFHAQAGMRVDCSFGFNDRPGFRRGIAAPFRVFDPESGSALPLVCLPTIVMDSALFDGKRSADEALESLCSLYRRTAEIGGDYVLDWHSHVLNPAAAHGAGRGLVEFVAYAREHGARLRRPLELAGELDAPKS
jgi:hypothetical protein